MDVHNVKSGETLSSIAKQYGTTVKELAKLNNLKNVNLIFAGKTLQLPETKEMVYDLPEVVVTAKAPEKKPLLVNTDINIKIPDEISIMPRKQTVPELIAQYGGKMQTRVVNGEKQQIAIIKNPDGKQSKFLVNQDGTVGESLVEVSTFGKNKYITQSVHEENIKRYFPQGLPDGIDVMYAHKGKQYSPIFLQNGKPIPSENLENLIAQQTQQTTEELA